jgi:hypothetical protein
MKKKCLFCVLASIVLCVCGMAKEGANSLGELDASIQVFGKYLSSTDAKDRVLAISNISDFSYLASDRELKEFLVRGLSDDVPAVRLASAEVVASNAQRVAEMDANGDIEKLLQDLAVEILRDKTTVENAGLQTRVSIEAMAALQLINYNKLPFPRYCEWEDENLIRCIESLADSQDVVDRYGAARLSIGIKGGNNGLLKSQVLHDSLNDSSDQVRQAGLLTVASFGFSSKMYPILLATYVSLRPSIERIAENGTPKLRKLSESVISDLDVKLADFEKNSGVHFFLKSR